MSYEKDLSRLDAIVTELEREDLELERALSLFQEGVERLRSASAALATVEGRVRVLIEDDGGGYRLEEMRD